MYLQGDQIHEHERCTFGPRGESQEERKTRRHMARQGTKDGKNWKAKGGQALLALHEEVHELHPANCPDRPGPDANQGQKNPNLSWQAKGRSQ